MNGKLKYHLLVTKITFLSLLVLVLVRYFFFRKYIIESFTLKFIITGIIIILIALFFEELRHGYLKK